MAIPSWYTYYQQQELFSNEGLPSAHISSSHEKVIIGQTFELLTNHIFPSSSRLSKRPHLEPDLIIKEPSFDILLEVKATSTLEPKIHSHQYLNYQELYKSEFSFPYISPLIYYVLFFYDYHQSYSAYNIIKGALSSVKLGMVVGLDTISKMFIPRAGGQYPVCLRFPKRHSKYILENKSCAAVADVFNLYGSKDIKVKKRIIKNMNFVCDFCEVCEFPLFFIDSEGEMVKRVVGL